MADANRQGSAPRRAARLRHALLAVTVFAVALLTATGIAAAGTGGVAPPSGGSGSEEGDGGDDPPAEGAGDTPEFPLEFGDVRPQRLFYDGKRPRAKFTYVIGGGQVRDLTIEVVNRDSDEVVKETDVDDVQPGEEMEARWKGKDSAGEVAPDGSYRFRVSERSGANANASDADGDHNFDFYGHKFPIRGPHDYGGSGSRFGAPRSGHTHQGQDMAAGCDTRLVAARGGRVKVKAFQAGGAGYYVVINLKKSDQDHVYMHLIRPAKVDRGENVDTGQKIGDVGSTGSSTGCHLHFEIWDGPWRDGGHPIDPLDDLKYWDSYS